jgi:hypothetical protein
MKFRSRTTNQLADMICGNSESGPHFRYRSSSYLTQFFEDCDTEYAHDGSTRKWWVAATLEQILDGPQPNAYVPPDAFSAVIRRLMDRDDALDESSDRPGALAVLNAALQREGYEAFYAEDGNCYLRHLPTKTVIAPAANPGRPLSKREMERRVLLEGFLDSASEDELTEQILLPLFRRLGFQRITAAGHKDKALEYGKDLWMKFTLPTLHSLYFGIQAKRGKIDAAGRSKGESANVAEVLAQIRMMLGHMVFDPEINKRALVDHAIIVAGGEITKQARNWLGEQLDASARSQILFMDRNDLLDLFVVNNIDLPPKLIAQSAAVSLDDDIPF